MQARYVSNRRHNSPLQRSLLLSAILISALAGCQSVSPQADSLALSKDPSPAAGKYLVRIENRFVGEPTMFAGDIERPMTVQDALEAASATKKYRNMNVTLIREVEGNNRPLRMVCDYDAAMRTVQIEQNYAIHPGDRILVEPRGDVITRFLSAITGQP